MKQSNTLLAGLGTLLTLSLSTPALAHVKIGNYMGRTLETGKACAVTVVAVAFEGGVRHPLNERITVTSEGRTWILHHPAQIDVASGKVEFSTATLEATAGVPGAADAVVLSMTHEEGKEGPQAFQFIHQDYRDELKNSRMICAELVFQE